jgi:hypothetical protein
VKIGCSSKGPIYADEMAERSRISTVRRALQDIADATGDIDAFIEQYDERTRKVPKVAGWRSRCCDRHDRLYAEACGATARFAAQR